jgi:hypothetical protein
MHEETAMRPVLPILLLAALHAAVARADEGMWQPQQLPQLASALKTRGLRLDPTTLADLGAYPMGAVVSLGGCTGSFVSPDGLIVTNHHCVYGALQYNATPQKNLIVDGFLAARRADELPGAPGMHVYVTQKISDVTQAIEAELHPWQTGAERYRTLDRVQKKLVADCETDPGHRCRVAAFYGGLKYELIKQLDIRDVRLVYAPPESIGKFGGDVDNWMWPRHTGDFGYLRAYVSPTGRPADYSLDNVPYHPNTVLRINPDGLDAGDFVMVAGYPGRTNRYRLADEVEQAIDHTYPTRIKIYRDWLAIIDDAAKTDPAVGVKYASIESGLNNYLKNFNGQIEGLRRAGAVAAKRADEAALETWLQQQKGTEETELLSDIGKLREAVTAEQATREREIDLDLLHRAALFDTALDLVKLADERAKPDLERAEGFQQRDWPRIEARLKELQRRFDPRVDRRFMAYALERYVKLPKDQRIAALDAWLEGAESAKAIVARVDKLYAGSRLGDADARAKWFAADAKAIAASDDSLLRLARAVQPELQKIEDDDHAREGEMSKLRPRFMQAMIAYKQSRHESVYPDANGTLRVTFGSVQGMTPRDAVSYTPFSTVAGILQKNTGEKPFDAPAAELDAIRAGGDFDGYASKKLGTLPVDFLADLDITGGNSGSPALDARGRLVGLAFDKNWESVSGDWLFDPAVDRSIQVDVRYMLWVMHDIDHADNLLREMHVDVPGAH